MTEERAYFMWRIGNKVLVGRLRGELGRTSYAEIWDSRGKFWYASRTIAEVTGIGGDTNWIPITEAEAAELGAKVWAKEDTRRRGRDGKKAVPQ